MNQIQPHVAVEARRSGLTVGKLRDLIARLPANMDVRFYATVADELHVNIVETYKDSRGGTLMLSDSPTPGAGATVIYDTYEPREF